MNFVPIQFEEGERPKYIQLFSAIKEAICEHKFSKNEKLPSVRQLAAQLNINNATVIAAYKELEKNGYVYVKKGSGYYINELTNQPLMQPIDEDNKNDINFTSATPHPEIFPIEAFKICINEVIKRDKGYAFAYQESKGYAPLRESLARYLQLGDEKEELTEYIHIVSGAQQGLDLISKALLAPGDYVITEMPTYYGAGDVFKLRGARVVGVSLEKDGIDLIELEKKIRICKPKLLYIMPHYQNPTTRCYSEEKLKALIKLAKQYHFYIVEDDSMSELNFHDVSTPVLKRFDREDQVIYSKSFSKLLMPGLRVGCLVLPKSLSLTFTKIKQTTDITSSGLIQRALDYYFRSGRWEEHLHYMKEIYKGKYEVMLRHLEALIPYGIQFEQPQGGLYFWVKLPPKISAAALTLDCLANGVRILASPIFYTPTASEKDAFIRLSFASPDIIHIKQGMECLKEILIKHLNS